MKFSIITPTHNLKYINELYTTIINQTYKNWEWIIYANGKAINEINQFQNLKQHKQIKIHFNNSNNINVGYLKNKAFSLGSGDILVEVDHDDLLIENCLEKLAIEFKNDEIGFVYSDDAKLHMNGVFKPYGKHYGWSYDMFQYKSRLLYHMHSFEPDAASMAYIWYMPDHVRAWRKTVYDAVGGHDVNLSILDDQDLMVRTYLKTKFKHIPEVLYIYRITGDNTWLERYDDIQTGTVEMFYKYAYTLAERDADLNNLLKIDMGGGLFPLKGYKTIDQQDADIICDLNNGIPLDDNSVGVINASHVIEHLKDPIKTMSEIYRVLCDGGWAMIEVPSTDGRGAWMDPTHVSYWNENSFLYYTNKNLAQYIRNTSIRFQSFRCQTHYPNNWHKEKHIPVVTAWLRAIKSDKKRPNLIQI